MMRKYPHPHNPAQKRLWSPAEIADYYGYEVATIAGWRKTGLIPCVELITGAYRYDIGKVREIMEVSNGEDNVGLIAGEDDE